MLQIVHDTTLGSKVLLTIFIYHALEKKNKNERNLNRGVTRAHLTSEKHVLAFGHADRFDYPAAAGINRTRGRLIT